MDIHPPHGAPHSVKEFLLQLLTITVGVLIALGLEGVVEWRHHRSMVHEAEMNLAAEIRQNENGLRGALDQMDKTQGQLVHILQITRALESDRNAKLENLNLSFSISTFQSSAWNATSVTGAIGYMKYEDVQEYSDIYDLQQQFLSIQQKSIDAMVMLESHGVLANANLRKVSDAQIVEAARAIGQAMAALRMAQDVGKALDASYNSFLQKHRTT